MTPSQLPSIADTPLMWVAALLASTTLAGGAITMVLWRVVRRQSHTLPRRLRRIREQAWDAGRAAQLGAGLAAVYLLLSLAVSTGILPQWDEASGDRAWPLVAQTLVMPMAGLVMMWWWRPGKGGVEAGRQRKRFGILQALGIGLLAYLASVPFVVASAGVYGTFLQSIGYPLDPQPVVSLMADPGLPSWCLHYIMFVAIFVAPVFEELLFRRVALPLLVKAAHPALAVTFVSLAFAAVHFHLASVVPLFVIAVAMALAYLWTGSILVPITMHALFNAANITLLLLARDAGMLPV